MIPINLTTALGTAIVGPLAIGSRNQYVRTVQEALNRTRSGPGLKADGVFGLQTDAAVRAFQKSKGLKADGIVGPLTAGALGFRYTAGAPVVKPVDLGKILGQVFPPMPGFPGTGPPVPQVPGAQDASVIAQIVQAVITGIVAVQSTFLNVLNAVSEVPDIVMNEIRAALSDPFQTAINIMQACARSAGAVIGSAAGIIGGAVRSSFQNVIGAIQAVVNLLSKLPDLLGLSGLIGRLQAVIRKIQSAADSIVDVIVRTLGGIGKTVFDGVTQILGILRTAAAF